MNKPDQLHDYEATGLDFDLICAKKKSIQEIIRGCKDIQETYNRQVANRQKKIETQRDIHLLKLFYHYKHKDCLQQEIDELMVLIDDSVDVQMDELIDRLRSWVNICRLNMLYQATYMKLYKCLFICL